MTTIKHIISMGLIALSLTSCDRDTEKADGYGNFETTELMISAENTGKLMTFNISEGSRIEKNTLVGYIDTIALGLKREQLLASKHSVRLTSKGVLSQIDVLKAQLKTANINKNRVEKLIQSNAGTQKQLDDVQGELSILQSQVRSIEIQNAPVVSELLNIDVQLKQIDHQIEQCKIINPIDGTVLNTYAEANEITAFGKPLYRIANLSVMDLRVYVSETQLSQIELGEKVTVKIDTPSAMKNYTGTITYISSEAEFTPKIIQTKQERVALVYAVKVQVQNDGAIKIGMPAEMWLKPESTP